MEIKVTEETKEFLASVRELIQYYKTAKIDDESQRLNLLTISILSRLDEMEDKKQNIQIGYLHELLFGMDDKNE